MNNKSFLILSVTLFFLSCSSVETSNKIVNSTPEEAMKNFDKALISYKKGESLSTIRGVVTQEVFDVYSLEDKYKKRKTDANYERKPNTVKCTVTGDEGLCIMKQEGSMHESKYPVVKQGGSWLIAGLGNSGKKVTNEMVAEMKDYYESRK